MPNAIISRLSADLVASGDRSRIERALEALASDARFPSDLVEQIVTQVRALTDGHDLVVMQADASLTTTQAAQVLGFSRPHLVKLCERGEIPFHFVGRDRRILSADVAAYLERRAMDRDRARRFQSEFAGSRNAEVAARADLTEARARQLGLG